MRRRHAFLPSLFDLASPPLSSHFLSLSLQKLLPVVIFDRWIYRTGSAAMIYSGDRRGERRDSVRGQRLRAGRHNSASRARARVCHVENVIIRPLFIPLPSVIPSPFVRRIAVGSPSSAGRRGRRQLDVSVIIHVL